MIGIEPRSKIYFDDVLAAFWHEFQEYLAWIDEILTKFEQADI